MVYLRITSRLLLLGTLVLVLAACGQNAPAVTSAVLPSDWEPFSEAGFSFALPPGWEVVNADDGNFAGAMEDLVRENPALADTAQRARTAVASGQIRVLAFDLSPEEMIESFTSNLSIGQHALEQPVSLRQLAEANQQELERSGFTDVRRSDMTVSGENAVRLSSSLQIRDAVGEPLDLAVEQVIMARADQQYIVTFTTTASQRDQMVPTFDQIMATFRIE
jgi:hypothetical protein